jgi:hypothetical protein
MSEQCPKCGAALSWDHSDTAKFYLRGWDCGALEVRGRDGTPVVVNSGAWKCLLGEVDYANAQLTALRTAHQNLIAKCAAVDSLAVDGAAHVHPGSSVRACKALNEWQQAWAGGGG